MSSASAPHPLPPSSSTWAVIVDTPPRPSWSYTYNFISYAQCIKYSQPCLYQHNICKISSIFVLYLIYSFRMTLSQLCWLSLADSSFHRQLYSTAWKSRTQTPASQSTILIDCWCPAVFPQTFLDSTFHEALADGQQRPVTLLLHDGYRGRQQAGIGVHLREGVLFQVKGRAERIGLLLQAMCGGCQVCQGSWRHTELFSKCLNLFTISFITIILSKYPGFIYMEKL